MLLRTVLSSIVLTILTVGLCTAYNIRDDLCQQQCTELDECNGARADVLLCDYTKSMQMRIDCIAGCMQAAGELNPDPYNPNVGRLVFDSRADPSAILQHSVVQGLLKNFYKYPFFMKGGGSQNMLVGSGMGNVEYPGYDDTYPAYENNIAVRRPVLMNGRDGGYLRADRPVAGFIPDNDKVVGLTSYPSPIRVQRSISNIGGTNHFEDLRRIKRQISNIDEDIRGPIYHDEEHGYYYKEVRPIEGLIPPNVNLEGGLQKLLEGDGVPVNPNENEIIG